MGVLIVEKLNNNSGEINLNPPTKEDKARVDANKQRIVAEEQNNSQQSKKVAKPTITYIDDRNGNYGVAGYVSGVFEDGGICSYVFTNGSSTKSKESTAISNVSYTTCPPISIEKNELSPKGTWRIVLKYTSVSSSGDSEAKVIEVQ